MSYSIFEDLKNKTVTITVAKGKTIKANNISHAGIKAQRLMMKLARVKNSEAKLAESLTELYEVFLDNIINLDEVEDWGIKTEALVALTMVWAQLDGTQTAAEKRKMVKEVFDELSNAASSESDEDDEDEDFDDE